MYKFFEGVAQKPKRANWLFIFSLTLFCFATPPSLAQDVSLDVDTGHVIVGGGITAEISPNKKLLATGAMDKFVLLHELPSGKYLRTLPGIDDFRSFAFSHDSSKLAVVDSSATIRIWQVEAGKELHTFGPFNNDFSRLNIAFSPDDAVLAVSDSDGITLLNTTTGEQLRKIAKLEKAFPALFIRFSADGKTLASYTVAKQGGLGGAVRLYSVEDGKPLATMPSAANTLALSSDGKMLACGGDYFEKVWDLTERKQVGSWHSKDASIMSVLSPTCDTMVTMSTLSDNSRIFDARGRQIRVLPGRSELENMNPYSRDGKTILSTTSTLKRFINAWDVASGRKIKAFPIDYAGGLFALSADGQILAIEHQVPGHDGSDEIEIMAVRTGRKLAVIKEPLDDLKFLVFSPDSKLLAGIGAAADDQDTGFVGIFQTRTGRQIARIKEKEALTRGVFSPDGKSIAATTGFSCYVWNVAGGKRNFSAEANSGEKLISVGAEDVAFSPDGKTIFCPANDIIQSWDIASGKKLDDYPVDFKPTLFGIDKRGHLLIAGPSESVQLVDMTTRQRLHEFLVPYGTLNQLVFSKDGQELLSYGGSDSIGACVWDTGSGKRKREILVEHEIKTISPDFTLVVTGHRGVSDVIDTETGKPLCHLANHSSELAAACVSHDGKWLATGDWNNKIMLWNLSTGQARTIEGHDGRISNVCFSPDGKSLASASKDDRTVRIWRVADGHQLFEFDRPTTGYKTTLSFSGDGKTLYSLCSHAPYVKAWNTKSGAEVEASVPPGNPDKVGSISAIIPTHDGNGLIAAFYEKIVLWEPRTKKVVKQFNTGDVASTPDLMAVSPDGTWLAAQPDFSKPTTLWNLKTGKCVAKLAAIKSNTMGPKCLAFSPDSKFLLKSEASEMKIWSAPGGRAVATLSAGDEINSVSFMPNGKLFITADAAGRLKVRRTSDLSEVGTIIPIDSKDWVVLDSRGHFDATPDGDKLVAGRSEGKELSRSELKEHCYQAGLLSKLMDASFQASDASKETVNQ